MEEQNSHFLLTCDKKMSWEYSDKLEELFKNAIHGTKESFYGEIDDADGVGQFGSIACGDAIVLYLKMKRNSENPFQDRIVRARYKTFGCTAAIAASEALCYMIEKQFPTPEEALTISNRQIVDFLGGMPKQKIHCSVMGVEVLKNAISDWANRRNVKLNEEPAISFLKVKDVIDEIVRPTLKLHGHDVQIIKVEKRMVYCSFETINDRSKETLDTVRNTVEKFLRDFVDKNISVIRI